MHFFDIPNRRRSVLNNDPEEVAGGCVECRKWHLLADYEKNKINGKKQNARIIRDIPSFVLGPRAPLRRRRALMYCRHRVVPYSVRFVCNQFTGRSARRSYVRDKEGRKFIPRHRESPTLDRYQRELQSRDGRTIYFRRKFHYVATLIRIRYSN